MTKVNEALTKFINQESLHSFEGRRGVKALCKISAALGYKDPQYFGQIGSNAVLGDLICMLEDNSGMIEAMVEWIGKQHNSVWIASIEDGLEDEDASDTDE